MKAGEEVTSSDELVKKEIFDIFVHASLPLSPLQIYLKLIRRHKQFQTADNDIFTQLTERQISSFCKEEADSQVLESIWGCYFLATRRQEIHRNALVSREYQALGMTLLPNHKQAVVYIPSCAEHRFVESKESTIPNAGYGLFLRRTRFVRQGTIVCEYVGRKLPAPPHDVALCPYMVAMGQPDASGNRYLDAIDEEGKILCFAALINDNGVSAANVELVEFDAFPGRVFVAATRDIAPGEEFFVSYGQSYWDEKPRTKPPQKRKRVQVPTLQRCRRCNHMFPSRLLPLHIRNCDDQLAEVRVYELDTLPRNEFTVVDDQTNRTSVKLRLLRKRAVSFVDVEETSTYANSHMDVVAQFKMGVVEDDD